MANPMPATICHPMRYIAGSLFDNHAFYRSFLYLATEKKEKGQCDQDYMYAFHTLWILISSHSRIRTGVLLNVLDSPCLSIKRGVDYRFYQAYVPL